jgi:predicted double-glycine peptidase
MLMDKRAGGEILGGLFGLGARPFVGAARSKQLQQSVAKGITRYVNNPIEKGIHGSGIHKGLSWLASQGARDIPGTPRLFMKARDAGQRAVFGKQVADSATNMIAHHPETIPMQFVPVPGMTPAWLAAKAGIRKLLGVSQVKVAAFSDELGKIAKVTPYQQRTQWSCSAACLKAVLTSYGQGIPELTAVAAIGAKPGRGAETHQIADAARKLGFDAFEYSFDSLDQVKILLDQGIPVICDLQSFNYPGKGHYVVLMGIDEAGVHLMDPNTPGNQRTVSPQEMNEKWWDRTMDPPHDVMMKWGIIVLPKEQNGQTSQ